MPLHIQFRRQSGQGAYGAVYEAQSGQVAKLAPRDQDSFSAPALKTEAKMLQVCKDIKARHVVDLIGYEQSLILKKNTLGICEGLDKAGTQKTDDSNKCDALFLEYISGGSLADRLQKGPINEPAAKKMTQQILEALEDLHGKAHITHRDLKPANIMLKGDEVILIDFGVSSDKERPQTPIGTPYYMAPEVWDANSNHPYTHKADLWSLGVVLYQCVTGRPPFGGSKEIKLWHAIHDHLKNPWSLHFPSFVSRSCREFILALLTSEPRRPDATGALYHKWFKLDNFHLPPMAPQRRQGKRIQIWRC